MRWDDGLAAAHWPRDGGGRRPLKSRPKRAPTLLNWSGLVKKGLRAAGRVWEAGCGVTIEPIGTTDGPSRGGRRQKFNSCIFLELFRPAPGICNESCAGPSNSLR